MSSARFVVLEGLDGSGTSTQAAALAAALEARGEPTWLTAEPTEGPVGRLLRRYLRGELVSSGDPAHDRRLFACLFAADRQDHLRGDPDGIEARLLRGRHVVCGRYVLSSLAYEGEDEEELAYVAALNADFRVPDLTVYLDCPVDVSLSRLKADRAELEIFENRAKLEAVRRGYERSIAHWPGPVLLLDATRPATALTEEILLALDATA